ncbi:uncharacterized protein [Pocillopora verrucosa]|uniref:uncharacterized protein n=1 Tax=Pocillopora verrucosa TaxID=203993 RepID=UPI003341BECC
MEKQILPQIFKGILFINVLIARVKVAAISCPSPPMTYASEGDNVTLCWRIVANSSIVSRYYVRALSRPVESVMDPVGSANGTGYFEKVYARKHDGNYINRATVIADLSAGMVYLKITNYTKKMDNVYCVHYQSRLGMNDLTPCHSQALLLRNIDLREVPLQTTTMMATETTTKATTGKTVSNPTTEMTTATPEATTKGPVTTMAPSSRTALIVMSCLFGVALIGAIVCFLLFCKARKQSNHIPVKTNCAAEQL